MKMKHILALSLSIALIPIANAEISACSSDADAIHCTYAVGLADSARWVKIESHTPEEGEWQVIGCFSTSTLDERYTSEVSGLGGVYSTTYSVCKDVTGKDCKVIGSDQYTISTTAGVISASEKYHAIDFSSIANNKAYPACTPRF